jgi:hypothetical protein
LGEKVVRAKLIVTEGKKKIPLNRWDKEIKIGKQESI